MVVSFVRHHDRRSRPLNLGHQTDLGPFVDLGLGNFLAPFPVPAIVLVPYLVQGLALYFGLAAIAFSAAGRIHNCCRRGKTRNYCPPPAGGFVRPVLEAATRPGDRHLRPLGRDDIASFGDTFPYASHAVAAS